jgi:hypothetical protein
MATDEECVGYARECVRLAGLATDQELRSNFFRWRATGWQKPCMSAARMRLSSNPLLERNHLYRVMVDDGAP